MVQIYKCPGCGGELVYESGTDRMVCPHCGRTVEISELEEKKEAGTATGLSGEEQQDNAGTGLKEFKCPSCGAAIVTDEHTSATFCSFCGNPTLIESRLSGDFKPSRLIPFAFDKKQAQTNFKTWKGTGKLTPGKFKSNATMEKVSGMYIPCWLYSYTANAAITGEGRNVRTSQSGDTETVTTDHYNVARVIKADYENVPHDASDSMPDDSMSILEPFDYTGLREFAMPYLSGFAAERYTYTAEQLEPEVKKELEEDIVKAGIAAITEYSSFELQDKAVQFTNPNYEYVLMPIWTLIFEYAGKKYPLYMNGQTGKIDGQLPISKVRLLIVFLLSFGIVFLIAFLIGRLL